LSFAVAAAAEDGLDALLNGFVFCHAHTSFSFGMIIHYLVSLSTENIARLAAIERNFNNRYASRVRIP
jgi:hypothetical protein